MKVTTLKTKYFGKEEGWICFLIPTINIGVGKEFFNVTIGFLFWDLTIEFNWEK